MMYEEGPKDRGKAEKFRIQLARVKLENQTLKKEAQEMKKRMTEQIDSLNQEL